MWCCVIRWLEPDILRQHGGLNCKGQNVHGDGDDREMGGWVYKGKYAEYYLLHITHFAYQMCK